jgi:hypothetical protein
LQLQTLNEDFKLNVRISSDCCLVWGLKYVTLIQLYRVAHPMLMVLVEKCALICSSTQVLKCCLFNVLQINTSYLLLSLSAFRRFFCSLWAVGLLFDHISQRVVCISSNNGQYCSTSFDQMNDSRF